MVSDEYDNADSGADEFDSAEPTSNTGGRTRLPVIIVSILLLAAVGAGLAFLIPPAGNADQPIPTSSSGAAGQTTGEAIIPTAAPVPTALPLPEATGEYSSTEVIVQVRDGSILRGDFVREYQPGQAPAELLDQLIQVELVFQEATTEGVTADPAKVDEQLAQIKAQIGGDEAQFQAFLDQRKVGTEENLRRLITRSLIVEQMVLRHTSAEQVHVRHILIATEATTDTVKLAELKAKAETVMTDLEGGADFAALAAERSDDPGSKEKGGDLGWALRGLFVGPFDEAVFSMKAGERRLVETQFGYHIIEVLEEPQMRPIEDPQVLQSQSGQQAFDETFMPWIKGIQQQAETAKKIVILVPAEQLVTFLPIP